MEGLFAAVRSACSTRSWSRGIELARADGVEGVESDGDRVVLRVATPGRPIAPTVILYPADEEWECDCDSTAEACEHVSAATIALRRAQKEGRGLPAARAGGGRLRYELSREGSRLTLRRVVVDREGGEALLEGALGEAGVTPTNADFTIDRILDTRRVRLFASDTVTAMLHPLAACEDVRLDGNKVRARAEPPPPRARVTEQGSGYLVTVTLGDQTEPVIPGVVLCTEEGAAEPLLCPAGSADVPGFGALPAARRFGPDAVAELVASVLPALRKRMPVDVRSKRLDARTVRLPPRAVVHLDHDDRALTVLPAIVYGDPPMARVEGDRLIHLGGAVPERDARAERRLEDQLRQALPWPPGQRVTLRGAEAARAARSLREASVPVLGKEHLQRYPAKPLSPSLRWQDGRLDLDFDLGGGEGILAGLRADADAVLAAWRRGERVAPLEGGGAALLPEDWLAEHGHRVAELLGSREADGSLPTFARPAALALCDALDHPRPADLSALAPLVDGFEALPRAALPGALTATLRSYQQAGVDWLAFLRQAELGGILADDMGLGKTLQTLCALGGRTLVVCPRSVVHGWVDELTRFRPDLRHAVYHGQGRALEPNADVTLTTYALLRNDLEALSAVPWDTVVLDEAQAIKNPDSQVARAAYTLKGRFRLALSGTPVENRLEELWSLMHFTNPGLLSGRESFRERYERPIAEGQAHAAAHLRGRIGPFVLRRMKRDVLPELPPRTDVVMHCELSSAERDVYDTVLAATRAEVAALLGERGGVMAALEALLRLRQAACHTGLLPGREAKTSAKVQRLMAALSEAAADGHKALVFSQWTSMLDRIEPHLAEAGIEALRLDGSTRDREGVVRRFQDREGPPVLLISLKAGGTGLNLTEADHVFIMDPWWNPTTEDQAADRAHRIGQDRPVMVYRLVAKATVEERILALQAHKRTLADAALGGADRATALTRDDLLSLLAG